MSALRCLLVLVLAVSSTQALSSRSLKAASPPPPPYPPLPPPYPPTTPAQGGQFTQIPGLAPVAGTETIQIPNTNDFLITDFIDNTVIPMRPHPPSNPNGYNILQVWHRDGNTWTNVPIDRNPSCGAWSLLPNGHVGLFAGHAASVVQNAGLGSIYRYDTTTRAATFATSLTVPRWYPGVITLPNGKALATGGSTIVGSFGNPSPGNDAFDPATNTALQLPRPTNAGSYGNFYAGGWVLPTGDLVIMDSRETGVYAYNYITGAVLATAPNFPAVMAGVIWEYPYLGCPIMLRAPVMAPGAAVRVELMLFGGGTSPFQPNKVASAYSARIGLNIQASGAMSFDAAWVAERMPGPRALLQAIVLPNGHVAILNGAEQGFGGLLAPTQPTNDPNSEVWIYKPENPVGSRYVRTYVRSRIARLYHGSALLTSVGDILVNGCSTCGNYTAPDKSQWDYPTVGIAEYRQEIYTPPYFFDPDRPRIIAYPRTVGYGASFPLGVSSNIPVTQVVLYRLGSPTHSVSIDTRSQLLAFTASGSTLTVQAPANSNIAPPGFYTVFVVVKNTVYSSGKWIQIMNPPPAVPPTIPPSAVYVAGLGPVLNVLQTSSPAVASVANPSATQSVTTITTAGSSAQSILLSRALATTDTAHRYFAQLWVASSKSCSASVAWTQAAAGATNPALFGSNSLSLWSTSQLFSLPPVVPPAAGGLRLVLLLGSCPSGSVVTVNDVAAWSTAIPPPPPPSPPVSGQVLASMSSNFEAGTGFKFAMFNGAAGTWDPANTAAAHSGKYGARVAVTVAGQERWWLQVGSPRVPLNAGTRIVTQLSVRSSVDAGFALYLTWTDANFNEVAGSQQTFIVGTTYTTFTLPSFTLGANGNYAFSLNFGTGPAGLILNIDDILVYTS